MKTSDSKLVQLLDRQERLKAAIERWFGRLMRAGRALDKLIKQTRRTARAIAIRETELTADRQARRAARNANAPDRAQED